MNRRRAYAVAVAAAIAVMLHGARSAAQDAAPATTGRAAARIEYGRGTALEAKSELDAAEKAYRAAIEKDPAMAAAHDRLGFVLGKLGRTDEAIAGVRAGAGAEAGP